MRSLVLFSTCKTSAYVCCKLQKSSIVLKFLIYYFHFAITCIEIFQNKSILVLLNDTLIQPHVERDTNAWYCFNARRNINSIIIQCFLTHSWWKSEYLYGLLKAFCSHSAIWNEQSNYRKIFLYMCVCFVLWNEIAFFIAKYLFVYICYRKNFLSLLKAFLRWLLVQ